MSINNEVNTLNVPQTIQFVYEELRRIQKDLFATKMFKTEDDALVAAFNKFYENRPYYRELNLIKSAKL